jgi:hypothetical protein
MFQHLKATSTPRILAVALAFALTTAIVPPVSGEAPSPALNREADLIAKTETKEIVVPAVPGSPKASGKALLVAMRGIRIAGRLKGQSVKIQLEPGVYDVGRASLRMMPGVDIAGSGVERTEIVGLGQVFGGPDFSFNKGVVIGADRARLRDLTVRCDNTSELDFCIAMANHRASPRLDRVRLMAVHPEGAGHSGLRNNESSPRLDFVEIVVANGANNFGMVNEGVDARPDIRRSTITATAGTGDNVGILNRLEGLPLRLTTVEVVATDGARAIGVLTLPPGELLRTRTKGTGGVTLNTMRLVNVDVSALDAGQTFGFHQGMYLLDMRGSRVLADQSAIDVAPQGDVEVRGSELRASELFVRAVNATIVDSRLLGGAEVLALTEECTGVTTETGTTDSCP